MGECRSESVGSSRDGRLISIRREKDMVSRGVVSEFNGVDAAHSHQHNHHQGLLVKSAVPSTNKGKPM